MEIREAMEKALEFERKGYDIYNEVAKTSFNPLVKKTFNYLAEQEQHHIDEIKRYMDENDLDFDLEGEDTEGAKQFFSMTKDDYREGVEFTKSDIEAYDKAMLLEKDSYNFYKEQHVASDDEKVKHFFSFLMEQEAAHYSLLENMKRYLENPAQYHAEEESWIFEG